MLISEFPGYGINFISKLKSQCANMTFSDKSRHHRILHKVTHKGGESEMNYIKIFQNAQDSSVSVGNSYYDNQSMHIFLDNFQQGVNILHR